jgi:hypothetical protein
MSYLKRAELQKERNRQNEAKKKRRREKRRQRKERRDQRPLAEPARYPTKSIPLYQDGKELRERPTICANCRVRIPPTIVPGGVARYVGHEVGKCPLPSVDDPRHPLNPEKILDEAERKIAPPHV